MNGKLLSVTAGIVLCWLAGCSAEPRGFTMHEPGVYKGASDTHPSEQLRSQLEGRFKLVQTDR